MKRLRGFDDLRAPPMDRLDLLGQVPGGESMHTPRILAAVFLSLLSAGAPLGAQLLTFDTFETNQSTLSLVFPPAGTTASSSVSGPGILGGERDITLSLTSGVVAGNNVSATVSSGVFSYAQAPTIVASGQIDWDGADGAQ